ncbi:DUF58 domain-containing protein [Kiloniella antarctica]|uniref:DUF58 domain-containing protein n=1 Tax=Kiloniella antarctica TaxID=1550907 RepID=A0ABW5BI62_9PROT
MNNSISTLETHAEKLASTLPPLLIEAERVASTVFQGIHGRRHAGQGDEFWQYRRYSPGDSPRNIDWRRSAKSQTTHDNSGVFIRQKERESAQTLWIWAGGGPGMDWSSQWSNVTKKHRVSVLSLALAHLLIRGGEKVALVGGQTSPSNSQKNIHTIARQLENHDHASGDLPSGHHFPPNGALVCFADFLSPLPDLHQVFQFLARQKLKVWLVQVLDPAEMNLPYTGRIKFQLPSGDQELLHSDVASIRSSYIDRIRAHNQDLSAMVRKWGWRHLVHTTEQPPEATLLSLYQNITGHNTRERQNNMEASSNLEDDSISTNQYGDRRA